MELKEETFYNEVLCESFIDPETSRLRVRPLPDQLVPTNIFIECNKAERTRYPVGTKFRTESVKVCKKQDGRLYLRAKDQMIYKI